MIIHLWNLSKTKQIEKKLLNWSFYPMFSMTSCRKFIFGQCTNCDIQCFDRDGWKQQIIYNSPIMPIYAYMGHIVFILSVIQSLLPWPWSLTYFLKTLTLLINFDQWVLERWYFTWVFLVIRPFRGYHYFLPCDLDLGVWPTFLIL